MFERINTGEEKKNMTELPDSFGCVFRKDPDSLVPKIESSIGDLSIRIKSGFGYTTEEGEKESFKELVVEFERSIEDRENQKEKPSIDIGGTVEGVSSFLEGIKTEMEKLSNKEKIKLEKNLILLFKDIAIANTRGIDLHLPVLARTKKGDISAMSYRDIEKMLNHVEEYKY